MKRVLFVCTGNSARSIIAESIINNLYYDKFIGYSAGSNPSGEINPIIEKFLKEKKFDLSNYSSKNFDTFINSDIKLDYVSCSPYRIPIARLSAVCPPIVGTIASGFSFLRIF